MIILLETPWIHYFDEILSSYLYDIWIYQTIKQLSIKLMQEKSARMPCEMGDAACLVTWCFDFPLRYFWGSRVNSKHSRMCMKIFMYDVPCYIQSNCRFTTKQESDLPLMSFRGCGGNCVCHTQSTCGDHLFGCCHLLEAIPLDITPQICYHPLAASEWCRWCHLLWIGSPKI